MERKADRLEKFADNAGIELFRNERGEPYADIPVNEHRQTWKVGSERLRDWLMLRYYDGQKQGATDNVIKAVEATYRARALAGGVHRKTFLRVGGESDRLYLDLCNDQWQAVKVTPEGWRVIEAADLPDGVRFRRADGMNALPAPQPGGSVDMIQPYLNLRHSDDFILVVGWLLGALRAGPGYPVLLVTGEQGSAKSTFCNFMRALIDPSFAPLGSLPRNEEDLHIAANNAHVQLFDNVSYIPGWLSDALCRVATGGGWRRQKRYFDDEEVIFNASRPIMTNGIDFTGRPDLVDRALLVDLAPIADKNRKSDRTLWREFETDRPYILGALLDACAHGLKHLPGTDLPAGPRMYDFACWIVACEGGLKSCEDEPLWPPGSFLEAYQANRAGAVETTLEADPLAAAVRRFMDGLPAGQYEWTGTPTGLKRELEVALTKPEQRSTDWPRNARALSVRLKRLAPGLRKVGVEITTGLRAPDKTGTRQINLRRAAAPPSE